MAPDPIEQEVRGRPNAPLTISHDDALVLVGGLRRLRRTHLMVEDGWYSCPLSEEGCVNDTETGCTCGAEKHNALVDALLKLIPIEEAQRG